jgi:hypothetical protein
MVVVGLLVCDYERTAALEASLLLFVVVVCCERERERGAEDTLLLRDTCTARLTLPAYETTLIPVDDSRYDNTNQTLEAHSQTGDRLHEVCNNKRKARKVELTLITSTTILQLCMWNVTENSYSIDTSELIVSEVVV